MLHNSLPRAFLAPGLNYLGYYGDEIHQHPYGAATSWHIPMENLSSYQRVPEHHALQSWDLSRSSTPCPLDLSLKPPPAPSTPKIEDRQELKKDHRILDEPQKDTENVKYGGNSDESDPVVVDDFDTIPRSSSVHSHSSYEQLLSQKESPQSQDSAEKVCALDDATRLVPFTSNNEIVTKYYTHNQKLLLTSPSQMQSVQGYHQQLLLTPQHHLQGMQHAPMTPPSTPSPPQCPRRKVREEDASPVSGNSSTATKPSSSEKLLQRPKKKHARRLKFDEDTSSPVSGTVILGPDEAVVTGDIDPAFNIVEVTEEARAELAKIENRLGPYQCKLCRQLHEDAFQLAQHRCSRIAHVEYRCPECDKRFSCPANLASHRRWHKPRLTNGEYSSSNGSIEIPCTRCDAKFTRQAALRKHLATQHPETNSNGNSNVALETQGAAVGKNDGVQLVSDGPLNTEMP
ncbi:Insulinoma-associated protein 2 [Habropoda laboriosa]|uniref:Insulinoma-associated protein 2 n=1 Tax=Habropoda laboriosa TaxID=597456 RepID=A0A0L7QZV2_9HYME|nr:PREDICTED: B-cell lymphoma 6 protein homolog [Habropoda laboriosa]KOC64140.1 Insulinoma-associated protein 2 [Habropoda laboriosa]